MKDVLCAAGISPISAKLIARKILLVRSSYALDPPTAAVPNGPPKGGGAVASAAANPLPTAAAAADGDGD